MEGIRTPWSHPWGSYPRSSNTKPPSAPAWAVSRQPSFRRPAKILSSGKLFCYSPGRRPPLEPEAAPLRWGAPPGEERQACPRHVQALPLHIACGRPPSCGFTVQFASALRFPGANGRFQFRHRSPAPPRAAQDLPASAQNLRRLCTGFPSHSPCGDASPRSWSGSPPTSGEPPGRRPPPPSISLD